MNPEENPEPVSDADRIVFAFTARYQEALRLGEPLPSPEELPPDLRERCQRLLGVVYLLQQGRASGGANRRGEVGPPEAPSVRATVHRPLSTDHRTPNVGSPSPIISQPPPKYLSRFEILGELGQGGMGTVYRAYDPQLARVVAVKLLRSAQLNEKTRQRFTNEGHLLARQSHPNIVQIYESGEVPEGPFLAMELVDGPNLQYFQDGRPLPPREAARLVATLADALEYAHAKGIVHRDLKPSNVLLTAAGVPKLSDFGLAAQRDSGDRLTATGEVIGTPNYLAPEMLVDSQKALGVLVDVYGLGGILYETLTGRPPFVGATIPALLIQVQYYDPVSPQTVQPLVPQSLETICLKCLNKNPEKRYASAQLLKEDLQAFLDGRPIRARPAGWAERCAKWARRRPALAAAWVVAGLALFALAAVVVDYNFRLQTQRDLARDGKQQAEEARLDAEANLLDLSESLAVGADSSRDYPLAALWSALAAKRSEGDPTRVERNRQRWLAYSRTSPVPWRAIQITGERLPPRELKLHPTARWLIVLAALDCQLWDLDNERRMDWFEVADEVRDAEFSPDGSLIALATKKGAVHVLRFPDGRPVKSWTVEQSVPCLRFTPDGGRLGMANDELLVWDLESDAPAFPKLRLPSLPHSIRFPRERESVIVNGKDGKARVYDFPKPGEEAKLAFGPVDQGGPLIHVPSEQTAGIDAGHLVTGVPNGISFWNLKTKQLANRVADPYFGLSSVAVAPSGGRAVVLHHMLPPHLYALTPGGPREIALTPNPPASEAAAFSADGGRFLIGNHYAAQLWNAAGSPVGSPLTHSGHTWPLALSANGEWFVTTSHPRLVRLWRVEPPAPRGRFPALEAGHSSNCLIVSRDGKRFVTQGKKNGTAHLIATDTSSGRAVGEPMAIRGVTQAGDFSADGLRLYAAFANRESRGWEVETGRELFPPIAHAAEPRDVKVTPDGNGLICLLADGTVELRDARTGELRRTASTGRSSGSLPRRLAFSPDGKRFLTCGFGPWVKLWNLDDLNLVRTFSLPGGPRVDCAAFSPSGNELVIGGTGGPLVVVFDAGTGETLATLRHPDHLFALAFDPSGERLLTACHDSRARVWNWRKGELAVPSMAHAGEVGDALFSPDGRWVATADSGQIRLWEAATGKPMTPWLPLAKAGEPPVYFANHLIFPRDGKSLLAGLRTKHQSLFDFDELFRPIRPTLGPAELVELSELNAGGFLDAKGGVDSMPGEEWLKRWRLFRRKHPEAHPME